MASHLQRGQTAAGAYCKGCSREALGQSRLSPADSHPLIAGKALGGAKGCFQSRETNAGRRQGYMEDVSAEDASLSIAEAAGLQTAPSAQDLHPQEERQ